MDTKEKICMSAKKLFVKGGYNGTSLSQIAKEAKVSKALLLHYFKNKDEIWSEVKKSYLGNLITEQHKGIELESVEEFFYHVFSNKLNHSCDNSDYLRFKLWEFIEQQKTPFQKKSIQKISKFLKSKQGEGELREDINIESIITLFFCSTEYWKLIDADMAKALGVSKKKLEVMYKADLIKIIIDGIIIR